MEKLDIYDYTVLPGIIRIRVESTSDPDLHDILSGIQRSKGQIYVDGCYYSYLNNHRVFAEGNDIYMDLEVVQIA